MTITLKDIGVIDGPLLLCGGAYSNLQALQALRAAARALDIPPERVIHTGDVVAYCGDPDASAALLREWGAHAIAGNVEEQLAQNAADCACGFEDGSTCDTLAKSWYELADRRVGAELRAWMAAMPRQIVFTMAGLCFRVIHGGVTRINRFIYETDPEEVFAAEFAAAGADAVIAGHSGLPFTRVVGGRLWHNSGAIGLPANDGTTDSWYSLLAPHGEGGVTIEHRRLRYDAVAAKRAMDDAGLPDDYARTLVSGLYPSNNSLPPEMTAHAGREIVFTGPMHWQVPVSGKIHAA